MVERRSLLARAMEGRTICLCRSKGSVGEEEETRDERAVESDSEARVACRLCSELKLGIWRRPRSVSERQLRRVFSS